MPNNRPNVIFIMSDDHASHAMSCYGSRINTTPNLDRIAEGGMRFDNCFCTNSICTPSRACILTGTHTHVNGVTTLSTHLDNHILTFPRLLRQHGYQTAIVGKWHLGQGPEHEPRDFDFWRVLPGQGAYNDPVMIDADGRRQHKGYVTDLITDMCLDWLRQRDAERPFFLMCHHKAPHRHWQPDEKHVHMYDDVDIPEPETFYDDYSDRASAAAAAEMRIDRDMTERDWKCSLPEGLSPLEGKKWKYQRYIKDYLRVIASIDDNVGRLLDFLDAQGLTDNTMVIYTSDQGFFLGDHGWFDKRFMYEESLRMPFIVRYPREVAAGSRTGDIVTNVDFAPTFLDLADVPVPEEFQGRSFRSVLRGETPDDWPTSMYYRYWMHNDGCHHVYAHYGIRTRRYKLIYYYSDPMGQEGAFGPCYAPEWELFDLEADPCELHSVYEDPDYAGIVRELKGELHRLQADVGDERYPKDVD